MKGTEEVERQLPLSRREMVWKRSLGRTARITSGVAIACSIAIAEAFGTNEPHAVGSSKQSLMRVTGFAFIGSKVNCDDFPDLIDNSESALERVLNRDRWGGATWS
jgi:hypothetical protein